MLLMYRYVGMFLILIAVHDTQIPDSKAEGEKRNLKLNSIVWLYHSLENFHVFIDGNGRTNLLCT